MSGQPGFFDLDERYRALSKSGDPLERLSAVVDFEIFHPGLDAALSRSDRSQGGRPPMDAVMMFKVLVIQALYGLADERTEFQIRDRLSFMRFLGLDLHGRVPDARTIWLFREHLTKAGAVERLFARFDAHLKEAGYLAMGGQMIDASIVEAPRQRNTDSEKEDLKAGLGGYRLPEPEEREADRCRRPRLESPLPPCARQAAPGEPAAGQRRALESPLGDRARLCHQKHRMDLFVRTIGIARARTKIGIANLAYNFRRYLYLETAAA